MENAYENFVKIETITFTELQKQAVAKALQAVAEESSTKKTYAPLRDGDVIDLSSDSENDYIHENHKTLHNVGKENCLPSVSIQQVDGIEFINNIVSETSTSSNNTDKNSDSVDNPFQNNCTTLFKAVINHDALIEENAEFLDEIDETCSGKRSDTPIEYEGDKKICTKEENNIVESNEILSSKATNNNFKYELNLEAYSDLREKESAFIRCEAQKATISNVINTENFERNLRNFYENDSQINCVEIIELEDSTDDACSNDDNNDGVELEVKKAVISLLELDEEDEQNGCVYKESQKTIDMLMHFNCPHCDHPCGSYKNWNQHTQSEHNFESIDSLNLQSIINRNGDICYQCRDCNSKLGTNKSFSVYRAHRIKHLPFPNYYKCRLCELRFSARESLRKHLRKEHYKICQHYCNTLDSKFTMYLRFICPVCRKKFKNSKIWKEHVYSQHEYKNKVANQFEKISNTMVECKDCDKRMLKQQSFPHCILHEKHKSFCCKLCNYRQYNIASVRHHIRTVHMEHSKKLWECWYCDSKFHSTNSRKQHVNEKHSYQSVHICGICSKAFSKNSCLLTHMRNKNHYSLK